MKMKSNANVLISTRAQDCDRDKGEYVSVFVGGVKMQGLVVAQCTDAGPMVIEVERGFFEVAHDEE
jgi:hypothetical protein